MLQLDLSDFFITKPQAVDFNNRLSLVSRRIYETGFSLETALLEQLGLEKKDSFFALLRNNEVNTESNSALADFFTLLADHVSKLPIATISLAFEPTEKILRSLSEWFTLNINRQVLFDIKIDPDLLAGAAITYNGKYFDFSVKSQFDQLITRALTPA